MEELVNNDIITFYKGKKVFVTGHTGFKGSWLICWLHLLGANIKGYALAPEEGDNLFSLLSPTASFESVIADIRDRERLQKEIEDFQPDIIFHLAAQALVRRSYEIPSETFEVNAIGTANLLQSLINIHGKVTAVIATTDKVYENKETDQPYKEEDVLGGFDPYSASKAATEIVINSFRNSFFNVKDYPNHLKIIISARAGNVIGGGDWSKDRLIPDIIRSLSQNKKIEIRYPESVRPWQHVLEPLQGYLLAAMKAGSDPVFFSGAYNFGPLSNDHLKVKEVVKLAINHWGEGAWVDKSSGLHPHEAGLLHLDISKAQKVLEWQPKLNSQQAIQWTIDWYRQAKEKRKDFSQNQVLKFQSL